MNRWFFPSWSGDFRLEADGDKGSVLTVIKPTPGELDRLDAFLSEARKKKWVRQHVGFVPDGKIEIEVAASVQDAGRILLGKKTKGKLTAIRSSDGKVTAILDDKLIAGREAATVRRPTLCCPNPVPGPDMRASEALQAFCTPRQWKDWIEDGLVRCYGNLSGRIYEVLHRHHPVAIRRGKIAWDVEAGRVMHCYDWSVPPAEEVLTIKLVLEHAEHWIRNASGCLFGSRDIYRNPFMSDQRQAEDGLADAAFMRGVGKAFQSLLTPR